MFDTIVRRKCKNISQHNKRIEAEINNGHESPGENPIYGPKHFPNPEKRLIL